MVKFLRFSVQGGVFCNLDHVASDSYKLRTQFRKAMGKKVTNKDHDKRLIKVDKQFGWLKDIGFTNVDCRRLLLEMVRICTADRLHALQ